MLPFCHELNTLPETIRETLATDWHRLGQALSWKNEKTLLAIGSGGSLAAAEFLALNLGYMLHRPTHVHTPLALLSKPWLIPGRPVWLLSAGGKNPDVLAAFRMAQDHNASQIALITANPETPLLSEVNNCAQGSSFLLPKRALQDGFLATHSLFANCLAIQQAMGFQNHSTSNTTQTIQTLVDRLEENNRKVVSNALSPLWKQQQLIVIYDPALIAAVTALETSLTELGLIAIQCVDFRNFAHGRHFGLFRNQPHITALSMTTSTTDHLSRVYHRKHPDS